MGAVGVFLWTDRFPRRNCDYMGGALSAGIPRKRRPRRRGAGRGLGRPDPAVAETGASNE